MFRYVDLKQISTFCDTLICLHKATSGSRLRKKFCNFQSQIGQNCLLVPESTFPIKHIPKCMLTWVAFLQYWLITP